jgi:hypothetical protein
MVGFGVAWVTTGASWTAEGSLFVDVMTAVADCRRGDALLFSLLSIGCDDTRGGVGEVGSDTLFFLKNLLYTRDRACSN